MKRLLALSITFLIVACKGEPKDYATLSGKIENAADNKTFKIFKGKAYEKIIELNEDGSFKDTLKVEEGDYTFQIGQQYGQIYLKNDNEMSLNANFDSLAKTIVFKGDGADINNFSVQSFLIANEHFTRNLVASGDQEDFDNAINNYKEAYQDLKKKYKDVDSTHLAIIDKNVENTEKQIKAFMAKKLGAQSLNPKGSVSPKFVDYENFAGGNTSLDDLKGKYTYIDVWATWCGPCIREIPSLKKIEKQFEGKNIQFVSISVDEGRGYKGDAAAAYEGWKKMIKEKDLGGIQLLADNGFRSDFIQKYGINSIPRFILIDPDGNVVNANAPRPSNPELEKLLISLGI
ncbi:TlpA family protein disulfide reductase [Winogradskyella pulchriflava]|uniref:TlpA family protein disulfide reductase n=1 Tax=Winogradskyella pulchriflava TaxID=1110688 RepID=A0ABV6QBZ5_9FLAO